MPRRRLRRPRLIAGFLADVVHCWAMIRSLSRTGSPPISLDRLARGLLRKKKSSDEQWAAFFDEVSKLAVSEEEAIDAAKQLSESRSRRIKRYATSAGIGAVASPTISLAGHGVAAALSPRGQRLARLKDAYKGGFKPEIGRQVATGTLSGGALQAVRENVQLQQAKKTYQDFLREHGADR